MGKKVGWNQKLLLANKILQHFVDMLICILYLADMIHHLIFFI